MTTNTVKNEATQAIWAALETVKDPEIPVISVVDLGIITAVTIDSEQRATVKMTPTFTACPAIDVMKKEIRDCVAALDFVKESKVEVDFEVAWTSDLISDKGREQIKNFGLAPPVKHGGQLDAAMMSHAKCPHCDSENNSLNALFGPTLCRSLYYCYDCRQGFQAFKPV